MQYDRLHIQELQHAIATSEDQQAYAELFARFAPQLVRFTKAIVQLYLRDLTASVVRPVKELKGFQKILLKAGETKEVIFQVTTDNLRFYNEALQHIWEPGEFHVMVGTSSAQVETRRIIWQQ